VSHSNSDLKEIEKLFLDFLRERGRAFLTPRVLNSEVVNSLVQKGYVFKKGYIVFMRREDK
jgi:hypothetical protein